MVEFNQSLKGRRILIGLTGSIAVVKIPALISQLIQTGAEVKCVITSSASQLISPLSISTLSRNKCYQDEDQWDKNQTKPLHIFLAEWADIIIVAPLTSSTLGRWVNGIGEGLLASILLASEKQVIAVPAMNTSMWDNNYVQNNWEKLKDNPKVLCLDTTKGLLACDRVGEGKMAEPELIKLAIESCLIQLDKYTFLKKDFKEKKVLITAGPTIEDLDVARFISNKSSGKMGVYLAQAIKHRGGKVKLIHGPLKISKSLIEGIHTIPVRNALDMQLHIKNHQESSDIIIMAAAISDFRKKGLPDSTKKNKKNFLKSIEDFFELVPDLLTELSARKTNNQLIMGFAAITGSDEDLKQKGEEKRIQKNCDLLFANPINRSGQGFEEEINGGVLVGPKKMAKSFKVTSKIALAHQLLDEIKAIQVNISDSY